MALIVNHNVPALQAYNAVNTTTNLLERSIQKLSTGLRINSAADDAAGLAISEKMRAQIRGLDRAVMNAQDGISMIQTAEGALVETQSILQRMRELSIQAANDTLTQQDRGYIQLEIDQLRDEVTRIGNTTQFNKKKLLDGSAAVQWSSSDLGLRAIIKGGLRQIDQFGQKSAAEGNYKIQINERAGEAEQLKSNIFKIKHNLGEATFSASATGTANGVAASRVESGPQTNRAVTFMSMGVTSNGTSASATSNDLLSWINSVDGGNWHIAVKNADSAGAAVIVTYVGTDGASRTVKGTFVATGGLSTYTVSTTSGEVHTLTLNEITFSEALFGTGSDFNLFASSATGTDTGIAVQYNGISTGTGGDVTVIYNFKADDVKGTPVTLGDYLGTIKFSSDFAAPGAIANAGTKLRDLQQFWNSEGRFLLDDPQTLTITLGNGKSTSVTLYGDDTVANLNAKLAQLGIVAQFQPANTVGAAGSLGKVAGTIELTSALKGAQGRMYFAGDEEMLKSLGFSTLTKAVETTYNVTISNAHTGVVTATSQVSGHRLIGLVHPNVDVVFDDAGEYYLHLADNTVVYQIGANEGEDMGVNIGDMRSEALGLNSVLVTNREAAARSITIIDNALDKVSSQRANLGAYQNRLEHTINNLTVAAQNLTASESRIRDTDMAKEMMNFTKLQIMLQAGVSMLAQANAMPQNVLALVR